MQNIFEILYWNKHYYNQLNDMSGTKCILLIYFFCFKGIYSQNICKYIKPSVGENQA